VIDDWLEVLRADAAFVAEALRTSASRLPAGAMPDPEVLRELRAPARTALWQAYAYLEPADDADPTSLTADGLWQATQALASLRRQLGDDRGAGAKPIAEVWVRTPFPERPQVIAGARRAEGSLERLTARWRVRVAVDRDRLAWFEARCQESNPTRVATVRAPSTEQSNRDSLELLVRKGPTKFS
jgi:hypothetical protein